MLRFSRRAAENRLDEGWRAEFCLVARIIIRYCVVRLSETEQRQVPTANASQNLIITPLMNGRFQIVRRDPVKAQFAALIFPLRNDIEVSKCVCRY